MNETMTPAEALEKWLGTYADSIPAQAYRDLCAIQSTLAALAQRVEELEVQNRAFRVQQEGLLATIRAERGRAEAVEAELAVMRKDAERYRVLRDPRGPITTHVVSWQRVGVDTEEYVPIYGDELDAHIDALPAPADQEARDE